MVQMRSECYRKGIGYLLGRRYSLPFAKIMRNNAELSDCRPSINRSIASVSFASQSKVSLEIRSRWLRRTNVDSRIGDPGRLG